ncbi:MAG: HAD-IIIC family phosphatase [Alphaproteobacteria bacterium]|nr:HAD-IIIC family phosphatase [Alphaproteobacteria bacterium]
MKVEVAAGLIAGEMESFLAQPTYNAARRLERELAKNAASGRPLRLTLAGNGNVDFLRPSLQVALAAEGFSGTVDGADYDSWIPAALLGQHKSDWWIVWLSVMGLSQGGLERREIDFSGIASACSAIRERGENLLVILPEASIWEDDPFSPFGTWRADALRRLEDIFESDIRLSVEFLQRRIGMGRWHASRYWTMAKSPCHPDAAACVGVSVARTVALALRPKVKAIVVDLDNTLWGGVVGDDGVDGIVLDASGDGRPYLEMQRFLKDISEAGVPLCVASKNDGPTAQAAFQDRRDMLLSLADIVEFHASWEPKHLAIRDIASSLNLGMDAICFIDDSPHERHEARAYLPDLIVPEIPVDPEERVPFLLGTGLFGTPILREEDVRRAQMYREEGDRRMARHNAQDVDTYLRSLEMRLRVESVSKSSVGRAASLVQKTNQFNVTDARSSGARLLSLAEAGGYACCAALNDRFGDAGIIGLLAASVSGDTVEIEDWVLSCRVFGRGVEDAMLEHLLGWARARNLPAVRVNYAPTERNRLISDMLDRLGFERLAIDGHRYAVGVDFAPSHVIAIDG